MNTYQRYDHLINPKTKSCKWCHLNESVIINEQVKACAERRLTEDDSMPDIILENLERRFTYHKPHGDQPQRYEQIRNQIKQIAYHLMENCPTSVEREIALVKLEEAMMWANASIARNTKG